MEGKFTQIDIELAKYSEEVQKEIKEVTQELAKKGAQELKQTTPFKRTGAYKKGWSVKSKSGTYTIYNKKRGGLTHLLENDRRIVTRSGKFKGMKKGTPHIKPVRDKLDVELTNRIKDKIKK